VEQATEVKMEFKNETTESIKYRIGSYTEGFQWRSVQPGETVDVPIQSAKNTKLTQVKIHESKKVDKPNVDAGFREKEYKRKLINIQGVGKKSAEDIIKNYPTQKELILAIKRGQQVHSSEKIDQVVKNEYE